MIVPSKEASRKCPDANEQSFDSFNWGSFYAIRDPSSRPRQLFAAASASIQSHGSWLAGRRTGEKLVWLRTAESGPT